MTGSRRPARFAGPVLAAAALLAAAPAARGCDLCAVYAALQARESSPGLYAALYQQYGDFGTLRLDGRKVANDEGQSLRSSITQVVVGWQVSRRWGLQANLPLIDRAFRRPEGGVTERGSVSGPGDAALLGHVRLLERYAGDLTVAWSALGGVKLPTGDSARLAEELSEDHHDDEAPPAGSAVAAAHEAEGEASGIHGHDLALGSGSIDGLAGTSLFVRWRRWFVDAEAQYALRRRGDFDYRYADDLTWSAAPGYFLLFDERRSLTLALAVSGERKGNDRLAGERLADTAITAVYAGPALAYAGGQRLYAELAVDLPVDQDNSALQLVPDQRLRAAFTWRW